MVKFSDLEKDSLNPPKSWKKEGGMRSRLPGVSFRDLEKETHRKISREVIQPKEISEEESKAIYDTATDYLAGVLDAVRKRRRFALESGVEIVRRMVESQTPVDPLLTRAIYQENSHGFLINHCVNVTVFAIKMAAALGFSKREQEQIGLASMLHEVGMGVIPEKLIYKEKKLDEQEYAIFKKRPEFAYKILKGFGDDYAFLAEIALQVHECMDGSGYPKGLQGDEIHVYAQIIGLVDLYEALIHSRPQREKFLYFSAVKQMIKTGKRRYQKKYLKTLLGIFSIFPIYSLVKLNSNAIGRVIQTYPDQPIRPKIEVIFDSQGRRVLTKHVVDLSENSILYIVDSVSEKEIAGLAEGLGTGPYISDQAATLIDQDPTLILDIDDADIEAPPGDDIMEITEDDFEPLSPERQNHGAEADRSGFTMRPKEADEGADELMDETSVQSPATGKDRWIRRYKWILLVVGILFLAGIALWQMGLFDYSSKNAGEPGAILKPPVNEKTIAKTDDKQVPPNKPQPEPVPVKDRVFPSTMQVRSEISPVPAAIQREDEIQAPTSKPKTVIEKVGAETAAGLKPAGDRSNALKGPGGSYPFSIKLDSFRTLKDAQSVLTAYRAKGLTTYWVKANLGSQGVWYRIFAGAYQTEEEALAVIHRFGLKNAVLKEIKYATLIGRFSSQTAADRKLNLLSDKGYSPYVIKAKDQAFYLLVGAFYTRKGAAEQHADLLSNNIQSQIVER